MAFLLYSYALHYGGLMFLERSIEEVNKIQKILINLLTFIAKEILNENTASHSFQFPISACEIYFKFVSAQQNSTHPLKMNKQSSNSMSPQVTM